MQAMKLLRKLKRSLGLYAHPLVEYIAIIQAASVQIQEMWQLGRDTIIYPPAKYIQRVVDRRWIGTRKASQVRYDMTSLKTIPCHIACMLELSCWKRKLFPTVW